MLPAVLLLLSLLPAHPRLNQVSGALPLERKSLVEETDADKMQKQFDTLEETLGKQSAADFTAGQMVLFEKMVRTWDAQDDDVKLKILAWMKQMLREVLDHHAKRQPEGCGG